MFSCEYGEFLNFYSTLLVANSTIPSSLHGQYLASNNLYFVQIFLAFRNFFVLDGT